MTKVDYEKILSEMTLEEKASLCSGLTFWRTKQIDRLGVPSVWLSDGPNGVRKEKAASGTNVMRPAEIATCFPTAVTMASSWDLDLIEEVGEALATESKALQVTTLLGPGVNIKRSPLCGRNFEYFSEDPFVSGKMGVAFVKGVQDNGVGVSLKHFAANSQEYLRMSSDSIVDERTLREIYLPAFEMVVKETQPLTVMCSYNKLNGEYLSDNKRMLTDILRDEWGYENIVVSDWGAVNDRVAGIKAGMDLEMPGNKGMNDRNIVKAVNNGSLAIEDLDKVVLRMLKFAYECKEKETTTVEQNLVGHHKLVRKVAANSAVLLKNDNNTLPLAKGKNIAVIGALAKTPRYQGSGSSHINPPKTVSFVDAMKQENERFEYADGYKIKGDGYKKSLIKKACKVAKDKDVVIVFIGLTDSYESEGFDRDHLELPKSHVILMEELSKVNKNIVVVLSCGSPVKVDVWENKAQSIINMYLGGQAVGEATYDVLFGNVNPSGKLAETFPCENKDNIVADYYRMGPRSVEYREGIFVGYRYFDTVNKPVKYPFGYGMSYTTFEYSNYKLSSKSIKQGEKLIVSVDITNTGSVEGAEVVQVYVKDIVSTTFRPNKELKGFAKVSLQPNQTKTIEIQLDDRSFSYYNTAINDWHIESGEFEIMVGASIADIKFSEIVQVESANPNAPVPDYRATAPCYYDIANGKEQSQIPAEQFEVLYGKALPDNSPCVKGTLTLNNSLKQVSCSAFGKFLYSMFVFGSKIVAIGTENPDMITKSVKDMPLRSLSGFTGGFLSQMTVEGIVDMCNGTKGGFRKFMRGFKRKNK